MCLLSIIVSILNQVIECKDYDRCYRLIYTTWIFWAFLAFNRLLSVSEHLNTCKCSNEQSHLKVLSQNVDIWLMRYGNSPPKKKTSRHKRQVTTPQVCMANMNTMNNVGVHEGYDRRMKTEIHRSREETPLQFHLFWDKNQLSESWINIKSLSIRLSAFLNLMWVKEQKFSVITFKQPVPSYIRTYTRTQYNKSINLLTFLSKRYTSKCITCWLCFALLCLASVCSLALFQLHAKYSLNYHHLNCKMNKQWILFWNELRRK